MRRWTTDTGEGSRHFDTTVAGVAERVRLWGRANGLREEAAESAFQEVAGPSKSLAIAEAHIRTDAGTTGAPHLEGPEGLGQRYRHFSEGPQSLRDWYSFYCRLHPDETLLVYSGPDARGGRESYTFSEALRCAGQMAAYLFRECGVRKGDRIAQLARNYPEWCLSFMAATASGCVAVPMNSLWVSAELEYGMSDSGVAVAFVDGERAALLLPLCREGRLPKLKAVVVSRGDAPPGDAGPVKVLTLEQLMEDAKGLEMPAVEVSPEDTAVVMYTSGTTGHPKGAVSTHRSVVSALRQSVFYQECGRHMRPEKKPQAAAAAAAAASAAQKGPRPPRQQECVLCPVPLFHATGTHAILLLSFPRGRRVVLMHRWDAGEALRLVESEKVTLFTGVPTMSMELIHHPDYATRDTSSLKSIGGGGAAPPKKLSEEASKRGKAPSQGWGLTESNALTVGTFSAAEYMANPSSCGRANALVDLKVVGEDHRELALGEIGEVLIRSVTVMKEYLNRSEATAEAISVDGWFKTGDVGKLDPCGALYILDRAKDLIIRGGENVSCGEVETALHEHAAVQECSVFAVPCERLGEQVAAAVVQRPGTEPLDGPALAAFCAERLAKFKVPTEIYLWREGELLPRGATGKIPKRTVRHCIQDGTAPCRKILPPPARM